MCVLCLSILSPPALLNLQHIKSITQNPMTRMAEIEPITYPMSPFVKLWFGGMDSPKDPEKNVFFTRKKDIHFQPKDKT